jgi:uncharacterized membrane protein (DUF106 family)
MIDVELVLKQIGFTPQYTSHPIFGDIFTAMIVAALIAIGLNFGFSLLRKKTTDIEKMNSIMKETTEWRKQYMAAVKKQDKPRIEELRKKQAYVNKMSMELQQQQMRPMLIYMVPSFMLWILVFPAIFGQIVAFSPLYIPWIMCSEDNVKNDQQPLPDNPNATKGPCEHAGQVYLWGWFLIVNFAFSGIISKVTKTSLPSFT